MATLTGSRLDEVLATVAHVRATVVGDLALDAYWEVDAGSGEVSIETGKPVRRVLSQRYALGGAANVAANLRALGVASVRALGLVGEDLFGRELLARIAAVAEVGGMLQRRDWQTLVYAKPIVEREEQSRLDFGTCNQLAAEAQSDLLQTLETAVRTSDVVVLNQQVPAGIMTPATIARVNSLIAGRPDDVFVVDARDAAGAFVGASLKLNETEAARLGAGDAVHEPVPEQARALFERNERPVCLTRGAGGMIVADAAGLHEIAGIPVAGPVDPVGAGDTVVAAFAAGLGAGLDAVTAAALGNLAAAVTVGKIGATGTASPAEIRALANG